MFHEAARSQWGIGRSTLRQVCALHGQTRPLNAFITSATAPTVALAPPRVSQGVRLRVFRGRPRGYQRSDAASPSADSVAPARWPWPVDWSGVSCWARLVLFVWSGSVWFMRYRLEGLGREGPPEVRKLCSCSSQ